MEILYSIINFLILAAIIVIFGRKLIVGIFRSRRERILRELDDAEKPIEKPSLPVAKEPDDGDTSVEDAKRSSDEKIKRSEEYTELECRKIMLEKAEKEYAEIVKSFKTKVAEKYRGSITPDRENARNEKIINDILGKIRLTSGDMAYLKHHDVLYVTLTSAYPLSEEAVKRTEKAATELVKAVGGRISYWVKQDEALIGGVCLRIGDTLYDGSVAESVYRVTAEMGKYKLTENDNAESISAELLKSVGKLKPEVFLYQLGRVISVSDGICRMDGLADIMYGEIVEFDCGERGMVLDIEKNCISCVIFGNYQHIESYSRVRRIGEMATVPVGEELLGRVVNAVGDPIDGKGAVRTDALRPIEFPAPGILDRESVNRPLHTGIKAIDSMVPIGKGQRELIVADRQTGKSAIAIDTIINQKGKNIICIYVGIGQKETAVSEIYEALAKHGADKYTVIVAATASESAAMQYTAPFAATAIGEYFMYSGRDVLIVYDDLSKHAVAYRELSLLLQRPAGREAYPGDIFYLHSRLLERSAQLSAECGGGSMTAIPIIETQAGDISSYIPTNVISITDGQIFLDGELFREGQRPAVNVGLSVSRVGGAAQTKLMKKVSAEIRTKLAQYRELAEFTQFGAEVDDETKKLLISGRHLTEILKQRRCDPLEDWQQALLLYGVSGGLADEIEVARMAEFEKHLIAFCEKERKELTETLKKGEKPSEKVLADMTEAFLSAVEVF